MKENGTKSSKHLQQYSDEEMLFEALSMYATRRHMFARAISEKDYVNQEGVAPTKEEISFAYATAEQADRLVGYAKKKVESPIIVMQ